MNVKLIKPKLIESGISIKRYAKGGAEIVCDCPKCGDTKGHFYVNDSTGAAYCHKCGHSASYLAKAVAGQTKGGQAARRDEMAAVARDYYASTLTGERLKRLCDERGLREDTVRRFGIGWADGRLLSHLKSKGFSEDECVDSGLVCSREGGLCDCFNSRFVVPHMLGDRVVQISARAENGAAPKWLHLAGPLDYFYNERALHNDQVVLVEGPFDVLALENAGIPAVGLMGTHGLSDGKLARLKRAKRIFVCMDGDEAGRSAAVEAARRIGNKARIISLPYGVDPCDFLRSNAPEDFEKLKNSAVSLVEHLIAQMPPDLTGMELATRLSDLVPILADLDSLEREGWLDEIKSRLKLKREHIVALRKDVGEHVQKSRATAPQAPAPVERVLSARFEGLVDIVSDEDGELAFLVKTDDGLICCREWEIDGRILIPPEPDSIPWPIARAEEVMKYYQDDEDEILFDDIIDYLKAASELPSEDYYALSALWLMHTYLMENFQYSPILYLFAVAERGKTRTGKALTYAAYRGVHIESFNEAQLLRLAEHHGATLFIDCTDIWRMAELRNCKDILLCRFERGTKVARVLWPDKGPFEDTRYYDVFGPTVIGTNATVDLIMESRTVPIGMPPSGQRFDTDVTPAGATRLRERLTAFRARRLGTALPEAEKVGAGRLGDIMRPLIQVVTAVKRSEKDRFTKFIEELESQRRMSQSESLEARTVQAIADSEHRVENGLLPVKVITDRINVFEPNPRFRVSYQKIGHVLASLGFGKEKLPNNSSAIRYDQDLLTRVMERYGVQKTPETPGTPGPV